MTFAFLDKDTVVRSNAGELRDSLLASYTHLLDLRAHLVSALAILESGKAGDWSAWRREVELSLYGPKPAPDATPSLESAPAPEEQDGEKTQEA